MDRIEKMRFLAIFLNFFKIFLGYFFTKKKNKALQVCKKMLER